MKLQTSNPPSIVPPASKYAQAVAVDNATRWLHISGQVGLDAKAQLVGDTHAQVRRCFANIIEVLHANDMQLANLVKITAFLTSTDGTPAFREVRDEMLDGHVCASTLLIVSALAHADWTVEIEAIAAA